MKSQKTHKKNSNFIQKWIYFATHITFTLPMSRKFEYEADEVAIHLMIKAGFNPDSMVTVLQKLTKLHTKKNTHKFKYKYKHTTKIKIENKNRLQILQRHAIYLLLCFWTVFVAQRSTKQNDV